MSGIYLGTENSTEILFHTEKNKQTNKQTKTKKHGNLTEKYLQRKYADNHTEVFPLLFKDTKIALKIFKAH